MEVCFWAITSSVREAAHLTRSDDWEKAVLTLKQANAFGMLLIPLFRAFKTMPISSFKDGFRAETGDSSAIQSEKFQTLDFITRGFSASKVNALSQIPGFEQIVNWDPSEHHLLQTIFDMTNESEDHTYLDLRSECIELDLTLRSWRGDHLGIVRSYLGIDTLGTGGESYRYLRGTYKDPEGLIAARHLARTRPVSA
jgi:tryptophan 2,3-dioxygenase